jgi:thiol-disulfide isomerase/thioredoxin
MILTLQSPTDNAVAVLSRLFESYQTKVTKTSLQRYLVEHPDYPSLMSLSDACRKFGIESAALNLNSNQLLEVPVPFIAHTRTNGGTFVNVTAIDTDTITYHNGTKNQKQPLTDFLKLWTGVVFLAEANAAAGEVDYTTKRRQEFWASLRWPFIVGVGLVLLGINIYNAANIPTAILTLLHGIGFVLSALLVSVSVGQASAFAKSLCQLNDKTDCQNLLHSPAAKITNWLTWSEVGLIYFSPLTPNGGILVHCCGVLFALWSVYYQWRVAKNWCPLCLGVVAVLVLEFAVTVMVAPRPTGAGLGLFGLLATIALWVFIKPLLLQSKEADGLKKQLRKFKNNAELFCSILRQQPTMPAIPVDMTLTLGNPTAEHTIVMVTNPYCGPCAQAHKIIERLLKDKENLNCQVIFFATNSESDTRGIIARSILSLPKQQQASALSEWYENATTGIDKWQKQFNIIENSKSEKIIEKHLNWCNEAKIERTPTFFFDGFKLPELYNLEDLERLFSFSPTSN